MMCGKGKISTLWLMAKMAIKYCQLHLQLHLLEDDCYILIPVSLTLAPGAPFNNLSALLVQKWIFGFLCQSILDFPITVESECGLILTDSTKPLPEPMLTYYQRGPVTIT